MSKGTTTTSGIVHSYFAIFSALCSTELHEALAEKYFKAFFKAGVFCGQFVHVLAFPVGKETARMKLLKNFCVLFSSKAKRIIN